MKNKKEIVILAGWSIDIIDGDYFIPYTHYLYIDYICNRYKNVVLISSVRKKLLKENNKIKLDYSNLKIEPIPYYSSYKNAILKIKYFYKAIKKHKKNSLFYCRIPDPFSWMPALFFNRKCIMHFVGDSIDAIQKNQDWSIVKKYISIILYLPEYVLTVIAAKKSIVYTNGYHIAKKLKKYNVKSIPVISSTLVEKDFIENNNKKDNLILSMVYLGYIRYSKGIKTIMELLSKLKAENVHFHFHFIGDGEMSSDLKLFLEKRKIIKNVTLHGHIEQRSTINKIINNSDLFIFPSLSEGSPRVILEAMSQKIPIISTPVGSLPYVFKNKEHIRFFDFNNSVEAYNLVMEFINNKESFIKYAENAFDLVRKEYTRDKFLSKIFNDEA